MQALSIDPYQLRKDFLALLRLSLPIALGHAGQVLLVLVDAAMIGPLGVEPLAAASFGATIVHIPLLFGIGIAIPCHILVSEAKGRDDRAQAFHWLLIGVVVTAVYSLLIGIALTSDMRWMNWLGQSASILPMAKEYAAFLAWSLLPFMAYLCMRNYAEALDNPWVPLRLFSVGFLLNIFLNWVFIYGNLGSPAFGVQGAGMASWCARAFMFVGMLVWILKFQPVRAYLKGGLGRSLRKWGAYKTWLGIGLPGAFQILFESGMFVLAGLLMGMLGERQLAAHHIAINYAAFVFTFSLGVSNASSIMVASALGAGEKANASRLSYANLGFALAFVMLFSIVTFLLRNQIPTLFSPDQAVIELAASYLAIAAFFHFFDGAQIVTVGNLRGYADMKKPALLLLLSCWGIGLPIGAFLAFGLDVGGVGIWYGLSVALAVASLLLNLRLLRFTWRSSQPGMSRFTNPVARQLSRMLREAQK